jgi:hypothetical protein
VSEELIMKFIDGPFPENYLAPVVLDWPLPERVKAVGYSTGCYIKFFESIEVPTDSRERRGAAYKWDEKAIFDPRRDSI